MKGRSLVESFLAGSVPLTLDQQIGYYKSKLLSQKGCDSIVYTEGVRETRYSLSTDEQAFYKSLPEWNEEHYGF